MSENLTHQEKLQNLRCDPLLALLNRQPDARLPVLD
jgi:hypothetical protein